VHLIERVNGRRLAAAAAWPLAWITVGLGLLILLPELGPVLAWPLLFGVPGTLLVCRVLPGLTPPGKLGVGIVVSVLLSAHVTYLLSLPWGFGQGSVLAALGILALLSWALAALPLPFLAAPPARPSSAELAALWRRHRGQWLSGLGVGAVTGVVLEGVLFHQVPGGWASGAANWSDFLLHVSIGATIQHGNFPPQAPFFAGQPLTYHWFSDFHAAIAATASSTSLTRVMALSTAIMTAAFGLVIAEIALQLFKSTRAAVLAPILAVFAGGFGWIKLPIDLAEHRGTLQQLLHTKQYDFDYLSTAFPVFHIPPVYEVGILVQRATAYGLPMLAACVLAVWSSATPRSRPGMVLGGVMAALSAPFNFFAYPIVYLLIGLVLVQRTVWRYRGWLVDAVAVVVPAVYAAQFVLLPYLHRAQASHVLLVKGWQDAPYDEGPLGIIFFYLTNLGITFVLALVALVRRSVPARWLLGGWLVALFAIPNVVQVSLVPFDSSKYFQLMWPAAALLAAWLMRGWRTWAVVPVLVVSCLSGLAGAVWAYDDPRVVLTDAQFGAAQWIESNTADSAVFVTASFVNMPTDLAGRRRITGLSVYATDFGYNQVPRDADVHTIYCGGDQQAARLMRRYGATYVLNYGGFLDCGGGHHPTDFDHSPLFETQYNAGGVEIWHLRS
jgi:hypothetical protein